MSQHNYATRGFGPSAVVLRANHALVGVCGIVYGPGCDEPEIIYMFDQPWWGQGLASEVVPAMLAYGLAHCGLPRVAATIAPENVASRRVAERAGMRFDRQAIDPDDGLPILVYYFEPAGPRVSRHRRGAIMHPRVARDQQRGTSIAAQANWPPAPSRPAAMPLVSR